MAYAVTDADVAMLRRGLELHNAGDFEALREFIDEDVVMHRFDGPPVQGRDALVQFLYPDIFEYQHVVPVEIEVHGDQLLVKLEIRAKGAASQVELTITGWQVWRIRDGLVVEIANLREEHEARSRL